MSTWQLEALKAGIEGEAHACSYDVASFESTTRGISTVTAGDKVIITLVRKDEWEEYEEPWTF